MNGLLTAATFLTRIPLDRRPNAADEAPGMNMAAAVPWFPVVGALVGSAQAAVYWFGFEFLTPMMGAVLAVATAALITGAFHHDGLADMADAFGGGWTVERRLEILKDSRLGTYGVTALALILVLEVVAISALEPLDATASIVAAHGISRGAAVALMRLGRPARGDGLGADYLADLSKTQVAVGVAFAVGIGAATIGGWTAPAVAAAGVTAAAVNQLAVRKIGGFTGDVLGAVQQLAHGAVLCVCVAAANTGASLPWWN